jgi:beta-lactamase regulating signal transducer with metallopeptidase domain
MTLGTSTFLVAVGAIMRYAVSARGNGFDVAMVGAILMIVGIFGAVITLAVFASSNRRRATTTTGTRGTVIVEEREIR